MSDMRRVGAFWSKTSAKGTKFYSGKIDPEAMKAALAVGETRLLLFKAKNGGGKKPDLELFAVPPSNGRYDRSDPPPRDNRKADLDNEYGDLP